MTAESRKVPPTKIYHEDFCKDVIAHLRQGYSLASFGAKVGCGKNTVYSWKQDYPCFKAACEEGQAMALHWHENLLRMGLVGKKELKDKDGNIEKIDIDKTLLIFALKTRFHDTYAEKQVIEHTGDQTSRLIIDMGEDKPKPNTED